MLGSIVCPKKEEESVPTEIPAALLGLRVFRLVFLGGQRTPKVQEVNAATLKGPPDAHTATTARGKKTSMQMQIHTVNHASSSSSSSNNKYANDESRIRKI